MKYYVYLSESKLEMLYSQIDRSTDRTREFSLGFDVEVLKGELKSGSKVSDTKYAQLETVISELRSSNAVGNFWSGKPYIYGELTMVWATFGWVWPGEEAPMTFWGYTDEHIALGLAGSSYHVIGRKRPAGNINSHSGTDQIVDWLTAHFDDSAEVYTDGASEDDDNLDLTTLEISGLLYSAITNIPGTSHRFEFLAKNLYRSRHFDPFASPDEKTNVLLATPLYVAKLD